MVFCSALEKIIVNGYKALNLQYFFTSGKDEVKAWTIQVSVRTWAMFYRSSGKGLCQHFTLISFSLAFLMRIMQLSKSLLKNLIKKNWLLSVEWDTDFKCYKVTQWIKCLFVEGNEGPTGCWQNPHRLWEGIHHGRSHELQWLQGIRIWGRMQGEFFEIDMIYCFSTFIYM